MQRSSSGSRESLYLQRWEQSKTLTLPSWWRKLAPGMGPRFWHKVETIRKDAGVSRSDTSAISYIIDQLRSQHERAR